MPIRKGVMQYKGGAEGVCDLATYGFPEADISLEAGSSNASRRMRYPVNSASCTLASFKSAVSKPSVNQL